MPQRKKLVERLQARKQASLAQLLFAAARLYNERAIERVRRRVPEARVAHTRLFPYERAIKTCERCVDVRRDRQ